MDGTQTQLTMRIQRFSKFDAKWNQIGEMQLETENILINC